MPECLPLPCRGTRPVRQHGRLREHSAPAKGIQQQLFYPPTIPGLLTDQRFHGAHIEDHCGVLMNEGERNVFGIQMRFDWI